MNQTTKICSHCGSEIKQYTHVLMDYMVDMLAKLANIGGIGILKDIEIENFGSSFPILRYWKLIRQKGQLWEITEIGRLFLKGHLKLHIYAVIERGKVKRMEGPELNIKALLPDYEYKGD